MKPVENRKENHVTMAVVQFQLFAALFPRIDNTDSVPLAKHSLKNI